MKSNRLQSILMSLSCLIWAAPALACVRLPPDTSFSIAGSYSTGKQVYHGSSDSYVFGNCQEFIGQYIVLVAAPVFTDPTFVKNISNPEGELPEDKCFIDHSPFKVSSPLDVGMENFYHDETTFLNTCLDIHVTDARGNIDALKQINCDVTQVSSNSVIARGPRCAFKIYDKSEFTVEYKMNPSCLDRGFLQEKGSVRPMDVRTLLSIYETDDLTPNSPDYQPLGNITGRISLLPDKTLMPVAGYSGTAASEWPMQYGAQIEFGKVTLSRSQLVGIPDYVFMKAPFEVNNNCPQSCQNGFCASPCDFYAPVAARLTLKRLGVGQSTYQAVDYWYQGNLVPARFLGELGFGHQLPPKTPINPGDQFMLVAEFSNPALTYKIIVDEAKQILIRIKNPTIPIKRAGGSDGLEGLGTLQTSDIIPQNPDLIGLGDIRDQVMTTESELTYLNSIISSSDSWPPYYNSVINEDQSDNPNRVYLTLKVQFRVASVSALGFVTLDKFVYSKESKIFGNSSTPVTTPPQIQCPH